MSTVDTDKIMTIEEVAGFLKLSMRTMYQMVTEAAIPCRKVGKQWRFDRDVIIDWFHNSRQTDPYTSKTKAGEYRILIVDDNPEVLEAFKGAVGDHIAHADIRTAADGLGALIEIGRFSPQLIIADITIPRIDGIQLCRLLKNDPDLRQICFIAVSGTPLSELGDGDQTDVFDMFLQKPVSARQLTKAIEKVTDERKCPGLVTRKSRMASLQKS